MAKTLLDVKTDVVALINNKTSSGNLIPFTDPNQVDYLARVPTLANAAQKEIATTAKKLISSYTVSQYPVVNALGTPNNYIPDETTGTLCALTMFDIVEHKTSDLMYNVQGATSYYFEVDNQCDVYVEEQVSGLWVPLPTPIHIQVTSKPNGYQAFKGFIVPYNASDVIRLRFSGPYYYRIRYIAMYTSNFATLSDIPAYTRYNIYTMPDDYFQLVPDGVVFKGNQMDGYPYIKSTDYFWQGFNQIAINYYNKGEYTIYYYRYPTTINDSTPDTYVFEIDDEAAELIPYYCAGYLLMQEKNNLATLFLNIYQDKLKMLQNSQIYGQTNVESVTGW